MKAALAFLLCCFATSCASPPGPPAEVGSSIVAAIDAGKTKQADELFDEIEGRKEYRQRIYPVLFGAARKRYEQHDTVNAVPLLRFLVAHYAGTVAARQALLYSLFIERSRVAKPDPKRLDEIDRLLAELRDRLEAPPVWIALVRTQQSIDRAKLAAARRSFATFKKDWDGKPRSLAIYVDDVERYLSTH